VVLTDGAGEHVLGLHLEILEDADRTWTIEDVAGPNLAARFTPTDRAIPSLGLSDSAFWLRFRIENQSASPREWLLEYDWPVLDLIELYSPRGPGQWEVSRAGAQIAHGEWEHDDRNPVFRVEIEPGESRTFFVRLEAEETMLVPLTLWSGDAFRRARLESSAWLALYNGVLLGLIAYHLLLFLILGDRSYLYYCLMAGGVALYQLSFEGIPNQHLWPDSVRWRPLSLHVFGPAALLAALLFSRRFLSTRDIVPRFDRMLRSLAVFMAVLVVWPFFGGLRLFTQVAAATAIIGAFSVLIAAVLCWRRGYKPGAYYLVAWSWVLITGPVAVLRALGIVPTNLVTIHMLEVGVILSSISLALGLAGRVNLLKRNLEASLEDKEELVRELRELNVSLEDRILERTEELEKRTRDLDQRTVQLQAASRHKSEFLANMSHELRTPLNAIIGFSEVLLERVFGDVNDKQAEYLRDIYGSGHHLLSLINDILDLSKIEAGKLELEMSSFHLPSAIESAMALTKERASRRSIRLSCQLDPGIGEFTADERKVKQILINLLSNAVKFTPEGGSVEVRAELGSESVAISVADDGIGIAPEDQTVIFEEFRQAKLASGPRPEGTGLGLALTRRLVELHGGSIRLESEPGRGSTFTFELPIREETP
jgi:signal transduction histidine kinase